MNKSTRNIKWALSLALLFAVVIAGGVWAATLTVDNFDTGDQYVCAPFGPPFCTSSASATVDDGAILGGERDIVVARLSGTSTVATTLAYGTDRFALQFGDGTVGTATLTWDGNDDDASTINTSLLNIDLTDGGTNDQFVLTTLFADLGNTVTIDIYCSATDYSRATVTIPSGITAVDNRVDVHVPFSTFAIQGGAGCQPADTGTTNARAIQMLITGIAGQT